MGTSGSILCRSERVDGGFEAAKATLAKIDALADSLSASVASIQQDVKGVSDTITAAIPPILADVKEAADAIAAFKIKVF